MYIPLLPPEAILTAFRAIKNKAEEIDKDKFSEFLKYYDNQWMKKEGPHKISVFGNEMRTTSPAEGNNRALNEYCQKKGSFVWFCASIRNQEYMKSSEFRSYKESGGLVGCRQKKADKVSSF